MRKFTIYNLQFTIVLFFTYYILHTTYYIFPAFAADPCPIQSTNPRVQDGLISTPDSSGSKGNFGSNTGNCVIGSSAAFAELPTYLDLKSLYYDQAKSTDSVIKDIPHTNDEDQTKIPLTSKDHLYYLKGNLTINNNIPGNQTGVIFIDGNLTFSKSLPAGKFTTPDNSAVVFVVQGNVIIDRAVNQIDAVIISSGTISTATNADGSTCTIPSSVTLSSKLNALTVNGSLISLDPGQIIFCRKLADNKDPAEIINEQPKYLVLLRNLYSDTLQKWSEI